MNDADIVYLNELVTRFNNFKSPNETQLLIIELGENLERSEDDDKKLKILIKAERAADRLLKARTATQKIMTAEKKAARDLELRKKIIWGAALKTASRDNPEIADLMRKLYDEGFIAKKDKDVVKADYDALTTSI